MQPFSSSSPVEPSVRGRSDRCFLEGEMKGDAELPVGDLHAGLVDYGAMDYIDGLTVNEREMWFHSDQEHFLSMNDDASMFNSEFSPLPDFPCTVPPSPSSLSFSFSTAAPTKTTTCSPSSNSGAVLKSDHEQDVEILIKQLHDPEYATMEISQPADLGPFADSIESFGYNDNLLGAHDFFDPASIFQNDEIETLLEEYTQDEQQQQQQEQEQEQEQQQQQPQQQQQQQPQQQQHAVVAQDQPQEDAEDKIKIQEEGGLDDELTNVFFEWLKSNKDILSPNDLRSVKLKKATIEAAAKQLGRGKEGLKQLLELVLEWVQKSHLQNKKRKKNNTPLNVLSQYQVPTQNHNTIPASNYLDPSSFRPELNPYFGYSSWIPPPNFGVGPSVFYPPIVGYVGEPYTKGSSNNINDTHTNVDYNMPKSAYPWPHSHFIAASHQTHGPSGGKLKRSSSLATKEARKRRMEKYVSHHRHHNQHCACKKQNQHQLSLTDVEPIVMGSSNCNAIVTGHTSLSKGALEVPTVAAERVDGGQLVMDRNVIQTHNYYQGYTLSDLQQVLKKQEIKKAGKSQKNQHGNDGASTT